MQSPESSAATTEFAVASRPVALMHERVVATYDTREEAEAALDWYVRTYDPPTGALFIRAAATAAPLKGRYPKGAVETALTALEAVRVDYPEGGAIRRAVDDALDRLYRFRETETGVRHPDWRSK